MESKVLHIITSNVIEGTGFKTLFAQNKSDYLINIHIITSTELQEKSFFTDIKCIKKNDIAILDTDSLNKKDINEYLMKLNGLGTKCIIYSKLSTAGLLIKARELLISGYVSKSSSLSNLINCVNVLELGGTYFDTCFTDLIKQITIFEKQLSLTEKKIFYEVLQFDDKSIQELSEFLHMSKHTVEVHLSNIYKKANVKSFNELIAKFSI